MLGGISCCSRGCLEEELQELQGPRAVAGGAVGTAEEEEEGEACLSCGASILGGVAMATPLVRSALSASERGGKPAAAALPCSSWSQRRTTRGGSSPILRGGCGVGLPLVPPSA